MPLMIDGHSTIWKEFSRSDLKRTISMYVPGGVNELPPHFFSHDLMRLSAIRWTSARPISIDTEA